MEAKWVDMKHGRSIFNATMLISMTVKPSLTDRGLYEIYFCCTRVGSAPTVEKAKNIAEGILRAHLETGLGRITP